MADARAFMEVICQSMAQRQDSPKSVVLELSETPPVRSAFGALLADCGPSSPYLSKRTHYSGNPTFLRRASTRGSARTNANSGAINV